MKYCLIIITLIILNLMPFPALMGKSIPKAMLMSAILPGTGEIYAGNRTKGVIFSTADIILLVSANRFNNEIHWLQDSYKQFALAKTATPISNDGGYYELLQKWYSSDVYNAEVELYFRNLGLAEYNNPDYYNDQILQYIIPEEDAWHWNNQDDWTKYKLIRRDKQSQLMNRKLAVGALIANRLISVLDTALSVKNYNKKNRLVFSVTPDFINNSAILNCSVEF